LDWFKKTFHPHQERLMAKVTVTGTLTVEESELAIIRSALNVHMHLTRAEQGCIVFDVVDDPEHVGRFNVYEEFVDRDAFEKHQARTKDSDWATASRNVERSFDIS